MSRYLSIECEWINQPLAADPLDRLTWARISINAAGRAVTRLWDRETLAERESIFVPAYPLARWLAQNWWALLYEPARGEVIPRAERIGSSAQRDWLRRHCLRFADSGLMLPRMTVFGDGDGIVVEWSADEPDDFPHMPGQFVGADRVHLPAEEVECAFREFGTAVFRRIAGANCDETSQFLHTWEAITAADLEEASFCRSAGRIGLDPYYVSDWPHDLVELLETGLGVNSDRPIAADFLEAIEPDLAVDLWNWVESTQSTLDLRESPPITPISSALSNNPVLRGYQVAQEVRKRLQIDPNHALPNVSDAAGSLGVGTLSFEARNHLDSPSIQGAVGWHCGRQPVLAGPRPRRESNARFLEARALYHAAFACAHGPRLLTSVGTSTQRASRTFAAELLAPQAGVVARCDRAALAHDPDGQLDALADYFRVSSMVVKHQLENAGLSLNSI